MESQNREEGGSLEYRDTVTEEPVEFKDDRGLYLFFFFPPLLMTSFVIMMSFFPPRNAQDIQDMHVFRILSAILIPAMLFAAIAASHWYRRRYPARTVRFNAEGVDCVFADGSPAQIIRWEEVTGGKCRMNSITVKSDLQTIHISFTDWTWRKNAKARDLVKRFGNPGIYGQLGQGKSMVVSSDSPQLFWFWAGIAVIPLVGAMMPGAIAFVPFDPPVSILESYAAMLYLPVGSILCLILLVWFYLSRRRGLWRMDDTGIHETNKSGQTTALRWAEVERVKWGSKIVLEGQQRQITICFLSFPLDAWEGIMNYIKRRIESDFDLTNWIQEEPASKKLLVNLLTIPVAVAALLGFAVIMAIENDDAPGALTIGYLVACMVLLPLYCAFFDMQFYGVARKRNREWRERIPRDTDPGPPAIRC